MAGGELRLGTTSMYMTTYITRFDTNQDQNTNLHGYLLGSERKLIAQNQALERVNRGKFSLTVTRLKLCAAVRSAGNNARIHCLQPLNSCLPSTGCRLPSAPTTASLRDNWR